MQSIEVFREEAHLRASALRIGRALRGLRIWPVLFRIGSSTDGVATGIAVYSSAGDNASKSAPAGVPTHSKTKQFFLWASFVLMAIAALVAVAGSATLRAWTLPGPQYGTLLWLAPGYGLFAGWLLFAAALNLSDRHQLQQLPVGHAAVARDAHRVHAPRQPVAAHPLARHSRHRGAHPRPGDAVAHAGGHLPVHAAAKDRTWPRRSC